MEPEGRASFSRSGPPGARARCAAAPEWRPVALQRGRSRSRAPAPRATLTRCAEQCRRESSSTCAQNRYRSGDRIQSRPASSFSPAQPGPFEDHGPGSVRHDARVRQRLPSRVGPTVVLTPQTTFPAYATGSKSGFNTSVASCHGRRSAPVTIGTPLPRSKLRGDGRARCHPHP
jgi:hypothetical protein